MINKRAILIALSIILFIIPAALATFNIGEPPEKSDVTPNDFITGNAVADNKQAEPGADWQYIFFLITLFIVLLGAVMFLFQRVKPK